MTGGAGGATENVDDDEAKVNMMIDIRRHVPWFHVVVMCDVTYTCEACGGGIKVLHKNICLH